MQLCVLHGAKREAARQAFAVLQIVRRRLVAGLQRLARRPRLLAGVLGAFIVRQGSARGGQIAPPLITRVRGIQPTIDRITDDRFAGMREFPRTGK